MLLRRIAVQASAQTGASEIEVIPAEQHGRHPSSSRIVGGERFPGFEPDLRGSSEDLGGGVPRSPQIRAQYVTCFVVRLGCQELRLPPAVEHGYLPGPHV